jgi:hypothetical protein
VATRLRIRNGAGRRRHAAKRESTLAAADDNTLAVMEFKNF